MKAITRLRARQAIPWPSCRRVDSRERARPVRPTRTTAFVGGCRNIAREPKLWEGWLAPTLSLWDERLNKAELALQRERCPSGWSFSDSLVANHSSAPVSAGRSSVAERSRVDAAVVASTRSSAVLRRGGRNSARGVTNGSSRSRQGAGLHENRDFVSVLRRNARSHRSLLGKLIMPGRLVAPTTVAPARLQQAASSDCWSESSRVRCVRREPTTSAAVDTVDVGRCVSDIKTRVATDLARARRRADRPEATSPVIRVDYLAGGSAGDVRGPAYVPALSARVVAARSCHERRRRHPDVNETDDTKGKDDQRQITHTKRPRAISSSHDPTPPNVDFIRKRAAA